MTALTLVRNETIKTTRRPAFWVTLLSFAFIMTIMLLERQFDSEKVPLGFPDVWSAIIDDVGPLAPFFAAILLIMLVTSEFSFRTARQNVIDGLSKESWFGGKLLLVPAIASVFLAVTLGASALGATRGGIEGAIIRGADLMVLGGYAAGVLMLLSGAFMAAMLIRGSGAAMAMFFFYITLLERIIAMTIGRFSPEARPALKFLPFNLFTELLDPQAFDRRFPPRQAACRGASGAGAPPVRPASWAERPP